MNNKNILIMLIACNIGMSLYAESKTMDWLKKSWENTKATVRKWLYMGPKDVTEDMWAQYQKTRDLAWQKVAAFSGPDRVTKGVALLEEDNARIQEYTKKTLERQKELGQATLSKETIIVTD